MRRSQHDGDSQKNPAYTSWFTQYVLLIFLPKIKTDEKILHKAQKRTIKISVHVIYFKLLLLQCKKDYLLATCN